MRKLILIRHAESQPSAEIPQKDWPLTENGRASIPKLADAMRPYNIDALFTSTHTRVAETGDLLAAALGIEVDDAVDDFDEHDRSENAPYFENKADFVAAMEQFFAEPADVVYGVESAFDARGRFAGGIYDLQDESPNGNIAIVTHGTVMALFVARCVGADAFDVWRDIQRLGSPCWAVLSLPDFQLLELRGL